MPPDGPAREVAPTVDTLPIALVTLSLDGTVRLANARLRALLDISPDSLEGATIDRVLTAASAVLYQSYLLPLLKLHGRVEEFRLDLRGPRGEPIAALAYGCLRAPREGDEARVDLTFAPIHERRRLEDDLIRIRQAAELSPVMLFQQVVRGDESSFIPYVTNVLRALY